MSSATRSRTGRPAAAAPANDAYTTLLGVSLGAMMLGIILLALDYMDYGDTKPPEVPKAAVAVRQPPVQPPAGPSPAAPVPTPAPAPQAPTQPGAAAPK